MNWIEEFLRMADRLSVDCVFYMTGTPSCGVYTGNGERIIRRGFDINQIKYGGKEDIRTFMIDHTAEVITTELEHKYQMKYSDAYDLYNRINYWLHACFRQNRVIEEKLFIIKNGKIEL